MVSLSFSGLQSAFLRDAFDGLPQGEKRDLASSRELRIIRLDDDPLAVLSLSHVDSQKGNAESARCLSRQAQNLPLFVERKGFERVFAFPVITEAENPFVVQEEPVLAP